MDEGDRVAGQELGGEARKGPRHQRGTGDLSWSLGSREAAGGGNSR